MSERISAAMRRQVAERAAHRCEYCGMPDTETVFPHEPDHIVAVQHGGATVLTNLAYTCFQCNRYKGPNIASLDPTTGLLTRLYNPREYAWHEHFRWSGAVIETHAAVGRATAMLLRLNDPERVTIRENLLRQKRLRAQS
jgi:hypothetical protein